MTDLGEEMRSECFIVRTHKRFLLRSLQFTQQYADMYRCRIGAQQRGALTAIQKVVKRAGKPCPPNTLRLLELQPGVPSLCVGVVYKQMKLLPRFLDQYQRELVRIDAGDDDGEDAAGMDDEVAVSGGDAPSPAVTADNADDEEGQAAAADASYTICHAADELMLEDSSGRILLQGLQPTKFCTGVVLGVYGTLLPNGHMHVEHYAFCGVTASYVPRPLLSATGASTRRQPCYIAFVCGLNVSMAQPDDTPAMVRTRTLLELLVNYISGNVADPALLNQSRHISRLVIGGNSIAPTDELKLKKKVKLDPSDHVRLNDDKALSGIVTSAKLMKELDALLVRLANTVEVELMPGDNDMSDAFFPQQPLHPVLLPQAGRYSSLRLVSNPFEFVAAVNENDDAKEGESATDVSARNAAALKDASNVRFFVTSGQNVNDAARETQFSSRIDTMAMIAASGCSCPTAPNTLFSYPFQDEDPFLFGDTPHCIVACDQPCFDSRYMTLPELEAETLRYLDATKDDGNEEEAFNNNNNEVKGEGQCNDGVRLICVPSFERSGTIVLVDVNSPQLDTLSVNFAMQQ